MMLRAVSLLLVALAPLTVVAEELPPIPPIARLLPPEGVKLPEETVSKLQQRLDAIAKRIAVLKRKPPKDRWQRFYLPDLLIFTTAVELALTNQEFYNEQKDVAKANGLLDEAEKRLASFEQGQHPWIDAGRLDAGRLIVRGYESTIDGSTQPYGLVFPKEYDPQAAQKYPLYIWLHGRGDKATNLHFLHERMTQAGQLGEAGAIVLHAFGRQCVGFKGPGEFDVLEGHTWFLMNAEREGIRVDRSRVVLIGFSMGGAGAWQVGAHRAGQFIAVAPGAGFAETALYTNTKPESVPWYERKLWGVNDVPCYTRNLFNTHVIAYSGENDKQIQAARVMEAAYKTEGRELTHLIGPGVEHKYEPHTLADLKNRLAEICKQSRPEFPSEVHLQTRSLNYSAMHWIELHGLDRHWEDSRVDAKVENRQAVIDTKNVVRFELTKPPFTECVVDGQPLKLSPNKEGSVFLGKRAGHWELASQRWTDLRKNPRCKGPIDDAFSQPFLVVTPTGKSKNPLVQRWVEFELAHFIERWRTLMRGNVRQKKDLDVRPEDIMYFNLVCFGDPDSNAIIRRAAEGLPITWKEGHIVAGDKTYAAASHVPALIYPNPLTAASVASGKQQPTYLVVNSGLTYREAHDKTNSQQNPKLPDWSVIDLAQLPDDKSPGKIAAAGFFDEAWKYQQENK